MDELQIGWKSGLNVTIEPMCYFCISDTFMRTTFHPLNLILSRIFPIWNFCKYLLNRRTLLYMISCTQSSWGQRGKGKENGKNELKLILNYLVVEFSKTLMIISTWAVSTCDAHDCRVLGLQCFIVCIIFKGWWSLAMWHFWVCGIWLAPHPEQR